MDELFEAAHRAVVLVLSLQNLTKAGSEKYGEELGLNARELLAAAIWLEEALTKDLLTEVRGLRPIVIGKFAARSYLELVLQIAERWLSRLTIHVGSPENWERTETWTDFHWESWGQLTESVDRINSDQFFAGLVGEREKLEASHRKGYLNYKRDKFIYECRK